MTGDLDDWPEEDDDDEAVVACPNCRAEVYEDAERCPACGEWITTPTHPLAGRPSWFVVLGVIGIVATIAALGLMAS